MLLKNGINLDLKILEYIKNSKNIFIYSPYIKLETLEILIENNQNVKAVFVRWETSDLVFGSSDLAIYPLLKSKGVALYRNTRLHLKAYLDDYKRCLLTTANISARALNIPQFFDYNYELGTIISDLELADKLYFNNIEKESILITDDIYGQFYEQLTEIKSKLISVEQVEISIRVPDNSFLISSLPMTYSVETLYRIYEENDFVSDQELNCALHDLAIYNIPLGLTLSQLKVRLAESFFSQDFVKSFLKCLDKNNEIYFGTAKEWIHKNCSNVPLPRKFEITENIQILFRWIVKLGDGKYSIDSPNYSQRLFRKTE